VNHSHPVRRTAQPEVNLARDERKDGERRCTAFVPSLTHAHTNVKSGKDALVIGERVPAHTAVEERG
jgi:hypothetical protein